MKNLKIDSVSLAEELGGEMICLGTPR